MQQQVVFREVVNQLAEKCVHSCSKRPIAAASLEQALKDIHFQVRSDQSTKKQAMDALKKLEKKFMLMRAQMKVKISV